MTKDKEEHNEDSFLEYKLLILDNFKRLFDDSKSLWNKTDSIDARLDKVEKRVLVITLIMILGSKLLETKPALFMDMLKHLFTL